MPCVKYIMETLNDTEKKIHLTPEELNLGLLDSCNSFNQLTDKEKLYTYYMYKACWAGYPIVNKQISDESEGIINFFTYMFKDQNLRKFGTDKNLKAVINYAALCFSNAGNYLSFGDSKFIPRITSQEFRQVIQSYFPDYVSMYDTLEKQIYAIDPSERYLGYYPEGSTKYFSPNMTKEDCKLVDDFIKEYKLEGWNTMAQKVGDVYYILYPASEKDAQVKYNYKGKEFIMNFGNFKQELTQVVMYLREAIKYVANENQKNMILHYINHFETGSLDEHKESQRWWIKDKQPVVENNLGFIETYRDKSGIRAEFEGFVAAVDKEKSKKLGYLIEHVDELLKILPWSSVFEKDVFNPPDFTALDVICFAGSGIPSGINIPNYLELRETDGFKNVSLENVINASYASKELPKYLSKDDAELFQKYVLKSFQVDVACHEVGHGTGKLFTEDSSRNFNFDRNIINPLTGQKVASWYKPGETWSLVFGKYSNCMEECRAECIGLLASNSTAIQNMFGNYGTDADNVCMVSWLWMIRSGVLALSAYDPEKNSWGQAHSRARYVIYKVLAEAGLCTVKFSGNSFIINVHKSLIKHIGIPALKKFMTKLHIYKSLADFKNGSEMFEEYSKVDAFHRKIREIYIREMKPRIQLIQPTLTMEGGKVYYREYICDAVGMVESYCDKLN